VVSTGPTLQQTLAWIDVKDRLPDSDTTVLVAFDPSSDPGEPVWLGWLDGDTWRDCDGAVWPVTYWMPLPEAPK
jgi:hypothetical protein